jgi:serine/threonine protein kinase
MQGEGYEREVETLKALSSLIHPNIMGFYSFQKINESVYIFIEFCPNGTLTDLIKEGIEEAEVLRLFRQLVEGMCYMNAKGTS